MSKVNKDHNVKMRFQRTSGKHHTRDGQKVLTGGFIETVQPLEILFPDVWTLVGVASELRATEKLLKQTPQETVDGDASSEESSTSKPTDESTDESDSGADDDDEDDEDEGVNFGEDVTAKFAEHAADNEVKIFKKDKKFVIRQADDLSAIVNDAVELTNQKAVKTFLDAL